MLASELSNPRWESAVATSCLGASWGAIRTAWKGQHAPAALAAVCVEEEEGTQTTVPATHLRSACHCLSDCFWSNSSRKWIKKPADWPTGAEEGKVCTISMVKCMSATEMHQALGHIAQSYTRLMVQYAAGRTMKVLVALKCGRGCASVNKRGGSSKARSKDRCFLVLRNLFYHARPQAQQALHLWPP
jgi:hypothetical protein